MLMGSSLRPRARRRRVFRIRRGHRLSGRRPRPSSLPQRALHSRHDRPGQQVSAGDSPAGRNYAGARPRGSVATTLLTGLTADCTELAIDDERSLGGYPANFRRIAALHHPHPQLPSANGDCPPARDGDAGAPTRQTGRIVEFPLDMAEEDIITKVLQFIPDRDSHKAQLAFADIVVAGGLGLKSVDNFQVVKKPCGSPGRRLRRIPSVGTERLDRGRPANRADRQNDSSEALHRGRYFRRNSASRGCGRRRSNRRHQHRSECSYL